MKKNTARFYFWWQLQLQLISLGCGLIVIFMISRAILLGYHHAFMHFSAAMIYKTFTLGFLFDLQAAAYLLSPFFVLSWPVAYFTRPIVWRHTQQGLNIIAALYGFIAFLLSCINFYYYQFFGHHIGTRFLGFFSGDTNAVFYSIQQQYPLLFLGALILSLTIGFALIFMRISKRIQHLHWLPTRPIRAVIGVLIPILIVLAARASVSKMPLQAGDAIFSTQPLLNEASINALSGTFFALQHARLDTQVAMISPQQATAAYQTIFHPKHAHKTLQYQQLYTRTAYNPFLKSHPPQVIFVQMESMGKHLLFNHQHPRRAILGKLYPYFKKDVLFSHMLAGGRYSAQSSALLMMNTLFDNVFYKEQSQLASAVAKPFKDAGYHTVFLSASRLHWYNLGRFLNQQYFDTTIGAHILQQHYPLADTTPWGVPDAYAFDYAKLLLKRAEQQKQPLFIYLMTGSNHAPYQVPPPYATHLQHVPRFMTQQMGLTSKQSIKIIHAFRYANDQLADLIRTTDKQAWGHHTIIAATGDHNVHELQARYRMDYNKFLEYETVFLLHIPAAYLPNHHINTHVLASHRDIFPTLYQLALSNATYLNLGNNLTARSLLFHYGFNHYRLTTPNGYIDTTTHPMLIYPWQDRSWSQTKAPRPLNIKEKHSYVEAKQAYETLLKWQIKQALSSAHHENDAKHMNINT